MLMPAQLVVADQGWDLQPQMRQGRSTLTLWNGLESDMMTVRLRRILMMIISYSESLVVLHCFKLWFMAP